MIYKVVTFSSQKLRVREKPSLSSDVVGYLYKNNIYDVQEYNDEWGYTVSADTGKPGYVSMEYLQKIPEATQEKIAVYFTREEIKDMVTYLNKLLEGE